MVTIIERHIDGIGVRGVRIRADRASPVATICVMPMSVAVFAEMNLLE